MDEEVEQMIQDCMNRESKMTAWEQGFIQSIQEQVDRGAGLTELQIETIEKIWDKIT